VAHCRTLRRRAILVAFGAKQTKGPKKSPRKIWQGLPGSEFAKFAREHLAAELRDEILAADWASPKGEAFHLCVCEITRKLVGYSLQP
jgi:hypothetical protein